VVRLAPGLYEVLISSELEAALARLADSLGAITTKRIV
jgi:hypothetical protein